MSAAVQPDFSWDADGQRLGRRLFVSVLSAFVLTVLAGHGAAVSVGLYSWPALWTMVPGGLGLFTLTLLGLVAIRLGRLAPAFFAWRLNNPENPVAPRGLRRRLGNFSREYWGYFLVYVCTVPVFCYASGLLAPVDAARLTLLLLAIGILVGLPIYFSALDSLGLLASSLGLPRIQISIKSKLMLLGGLLPLLSSALLMHYYWWRTGFIAAETMLLWLALGTVSIIITALTIRSLSQALRPVQALLAGSGASRNTDLSLLRAHSLDEIGQLIQTVGKLFRRLDEQNSHVRAIIDTAAEGIIVTAEDGVVRTFNPAAERLFGVRAQEIRGQALGRLLPDLVTLDGGPIIAEGEQEVEGVHRSGRRMPMSVRVSEMQLSGRRMFTCLVADISERKAAEVMRLDAEARLRDLVETAHDLVWSLDSEGRWTYLNEASLTIYGRYPEEMLGRNIAEFQAPECRERTERTLRELLSGRDLVHYETVHLHRDGTPRSLSFNAKAQLDADGRVVRISGTARDITEQKAYEQKLFYQAQHDTLTGLYNRHFFQQELERVVARLARSGAECALFYIDLDQFKYINDTLGHAAGDRLLIECTAMFGAQLREGDLLARFGGDEFTILLYNIDTAAALTVAEKLRAAFEGYRFHEGGNAFSVTCSLGVAVMDNHTGSADEVLAHADLACNTAKVQGRNRVHLYDPAQRDLAGMAEDMGWAARVREAIEKDRFRLVYQPIVSLADDKIHGYEALLRMICDDGKEILPGGFLPAAERFGMIHGVDRWMVRMAIQRLACENRQAERPVYFSINLSGRAFEDKGLLPLIQRTLQETGLNPALVTFEITETAAIAKLSSATDFIVKLKALGCQFALDDFGSGFCSFSYLKHLPVDKLKIDGAFIQGLPQSPIDQAMVQSMAQVARALGKVTVAEFVEDAQSLALLKTYGVDYAQGYFLGQPSGSLGGHYLH